MRRGRTPGRAEARSAPTFPSFHPTGIPASAGIPHEYFATLSTKDENKVALAYAGVRLAIGAASPSRNLNWRPEGTAKCCLALSRAREVMSF